MRNEMITLIDKLELMNIPFAITMQNFGDGNEYPHVMYPDDWDNGCKCSVICHPYSYGGEEGLLEIMGLLTEEEEAGDTGDDSAVLGWLTANDVFARIFVDWIENQ